jgi:hypothetical protein
LSERLQAEFVQYACFNVSIAEEEKPGMESPKPDRIRRRKNRAALEHAVTGGHPHIGHLPVYVQEIEGWTFRRCRCGFTLALTPSGAILWLKTTKPATEINNFKSLLRALYSNCWVHPRPQPLKVAATPVQAIANIGTETSETLASKAAISTPPQQASSKTHNESKPTSKQVMPEMSRLEKAPPIEQRVDKPPPVKQRRTYFPETTTRRTRERQKPFGR